MGKKRILLISDVHNCHKVWYEVENEERWERFVKHVNEEYEREPFEMMLFLGDYSLDFWAWEMKGCYINERRSRTAEAVESYLSRLPDVPRFLLPGNHEQYSEEMWHKITGNSREGYIIFDDIIFYMRDSYAADLDPDFHSDGTYTLLDSKPIRAVMDKHPEKKLVICQHYFKTELEIDNPDARELLSHERVICLFAGHNHKAHVEELPAELGSKKLIFTGNYSYNNHNDDPEPYFWGFRELMIDGDTLTSSYIIPENDMAPGGRKTHIPYHTSDEIKINF